MGVVDTVATDDFVFEDVSKDSSEGVSEVYDANDDSLDEISVKGHHVV